MILLKENQTIRNGKIITIKSIKKLTAKSKKKINKFYKQIKNI